RFFGESEELLGRYAWYTKNSQDKAMLPVGQTRPNDWGLFDMFGNALEWCQEAIDRYPHPYMGKPIEDKEELNNASPHTLGVIIQDTLSRGLRGGSFADQAVYARSANRDWN